MTLVVMRIRVADIQDLQRNFDQRHALKQSYGCTSSRLLLGSEDQHSVAITMEFPSLDDAQRYCTATGAFLSVHSVAAMTILSLEYFEDAPQAEITPLPTVLTGTIPVAPVVS
jgi:hypothetical protein